MRTYKLTVSYDGTRYQGWQKQQNTERTIQGTLEKTISRAAGYPVEVNGSGRTDARVHAKGQVLSVVLSGKAAEEEFRKNINALLPEDIRILDVRLVPNGFHARYSAVGKCYEYHIDIREKPGVFTRRYAFHYPEKLDLQKMRKAADVLLGTHDFAAFTDKKEEKSTRRTIYDIMIDGQGGEVRIEYRGNGFLYHMVRILTGTLLLAGAGRLSEDDIRRALETQKRELAGFTAPAKGLFLKEVYYERGRYV